MIKVILTYIPGNADAGPTIEGSKVSQAEHYYLEGCD